MEENRVLAFAEASALEASDKLLGGSKTIQG
jgi:hypothetical protein